MSRPRIDSDAATSLAPATVVSADDTLPPKLTPVTARIVARAARHFTELLTWLMEFRAAVRDFCREYEFAIGDLRGYVDLCPICCVDVHNVGEVCPEQWVGLCDIDGPVMLDRFLNCPDPNWRFHYVTRRRRYVAPRDASKTEEVIHAVAT